MSHQGPKLSTRYKLLGFKIEDKDGGGDTWQGLSLTSVGICNGAIPRLRLLTSKSQGTQPIPRDLYEKHRAAKHLFDQYLSQIQVAERQDEHVQHGKHDTCHEGVDLYPYSSTKMSRIGCFQVFFPPDFHIKNQLLNPG